MPGIRHGRADESLSFQLPVRDHPPRMRELPSGTVTLLFTDIEGSTRLLQELGPEPYVEALTIHRRLLRRAVAENGGVEVEMQGDSFHFAFQTAAQGTKAAPPRLRRRSPSTRGRPSRSASAWASTPASRRPRTASTPASTSIGPRGS